MEEIGWKFLKENFMKEFFMKLMVWLTKARIWQKPTWLSAFITQILDNI
jgi:hypothetical protein